MKWSMLKAMARAMRPRMKMSEWSFVTILLLAACQPVRLEPVQAIDVVSQQEAGSIYTTLGCLAKPDERIVVGDPTRVREELETFYDRYSSDIAYRSRFGKEADAAVPDFRPVEQYDLTPAVNHKLAPLPGGDTGGAQAAFLYRGKDVALLDKIF